MATSASAGPGKTWTVTIENMQFNPQELSVHRGDRVVFVNKDLFPHTATAVRKAFDSGSIAANASWSYVALKPGDYAYGCSFHPTMKARLRVQ
jgi:plastocyanin